MSLIDNIIRPDVRALSAYHVQDAAGCVKLDAMENPYQLPEPLRAELGRRLADVAMNRYPAPSYTALKAAICDIWNGHGLCEDHGQLGYWKLGKYIDLAIALQPERGKP